MALRGARDALSRIFYQRCFYLFAILVVMIAIVPFTPGSDHGRMVLNLVNLFLLIATVAAVGRSMISFVIAILRYAVDVDGGEAGEPEEIALKDRVLQLLAVAWIGAVGGAVYLF